MFVTVLSAQNNRRHTDKCRHNRLLNVPTTQKEQTGVNIQSCYKRNRRFQRYLASKALP